jgi:geranylgeranyl diphosphate synthase type I
MTQPQPFDPERGGELVIPKSLEQIAFESKTVEYKGQINETIRQYCDAERQRLARSENNPAVYAAAYAYLDILERGGGRVRGTLAMIGYEMAGGDNPEVALAAALHAEMVHAYFLVVDDIQDKSDKRKDEPTAHRLVEAALDFAWGGPTLSQTDVYDNTKMKAEGYYNKAALGVLMNLEATDPNDRLAALRIAVNATDRAADGQIRDRSNIWNPNKNEDEILRTYTEKTADYSFVAPLQIGMALAGATDEQLDSVVSFGRNLGVAYQIRDDLLIVEKGKNTSGKPRDGDIKAGTLTLPIFYGIQLTSPEVIGNDSLLADNKFLVRKIVTKDTKGFGRFQDILINCGAVKLASQLADRYAEQAVEDVDALARLWPEQTEHVSFLRQLAQQN